MSNIDNLTFKQLKEIAGMFGSQTPGNKTHPFKVDNPYYIRTVTMTIVGHLKAVFDGELVLSKASWIADSGRFSDAIKKGELDEVEPFNFDEDVIVGRGAIIDCTIWSHELPTKQK